MASSYVSYYQIMVSKSREFSDYLSGYDYSKVPAEPIYSNDVVVPLTTLSGDVSSFNAVGLEPNTPYYFKVSACNRAGCNSVILGPIWTRKEAEITKPMSARYRQDPINGLVTMWWEQDIAIDYSEITITKVTSTGGRTHSYKVGRGLTLFTLQLAAGSYDVVIETFVSGVRCGHIVFPMTVNDYRRCLVTDTLSISEKILSGDRACFLDTNDSFTASDSFDCYYVIKPTKQYITIEFNDGFDISDTIPCKHTTGYAEFKDLLEIFYDAITIKQDNIEAAGNSYLYFNDSIAFTFEDFFVPDTPVPVDPDPEPPTGKTYLYLEVMDEFFRVDDSLFAAAGPIHTFVESVRLFDMSFVNDSLIDSAKDSVYLVDTAQSVDIGFNVVEESTYFCDVIDDSYVGTYYDFTYMNW